MRKITSTVLILLMSFSFFSFANSADEKINEEKSAMDFYDGMSLNFFMLCHSGKTQILFLVNFFPG